MVVIMSIVSFEAYSQALSDYSYSQNETEISSSSQKAEASYSMLSVLTPSFTGILAATASYYLGQSSRVIMGIGGTTAITTSIIYERISRVSQTLTTQNKQVPKNTEKLETDKSFFNGPIIEKANIKGDAKKNSKFEKANSEMITFLESGPGKVPQQKNLPKNEFRQFVRGLVKQKHFELVQKSLEKVQQLESIAEESNNASFHETAKEAREILIIREKSNGKMSPSLQEISACSLLLEKAIEIATK